MTKDITDIVPEETLNEIFMQLTKGKTDSKLSIFYLYWLWGFPTPYCAKKAGYKESYGYKLVEKYKKQPKVRQRVDEILNMFPDRYRAVCKMRLPQVAEIEGLALDEYQRKPGLAIDKPQLLKQVKQGGGVDLGERDTPPTTTINIKTIEKIQVAMQDVLKGRLIESTDTDTK